MLELYQGMSNGERPEHQVKDLQFNNMKLHLHYDTIYYGLVSNDQFTEEKAQGLLVDVKAIIVKKYRGNIQYMLKQSNLEKNCLAPFCQPAILKKIDSYSTSISSKNLNAAFAKVDEIKNITADTILKMSDNLQKGAEMQEMS